LGQYEPLGNFREEEFLLVMWSQVSLLSGLLGSLSQGNFVFGSSLCLASCPDHSKNQ
jgi:hypothetical protein